MWIRVWIHILIRILRDGQGNEAPGGETRGTHDGITHPRGTGQKSDIRRAVSDIFRTFAARTG